MVKAAADTADRWICRWIPGIIAWPLRAILALAVFMLSALLMPPKNFKEFCAEIDKEIKAEEQDA